MRKYSCVMLLIALLLSFLATPAFSVLYKWVDEKGQTHITDYPGPEGRGEEVSPSLEERKPERKEAQEAGHTASVLTHKQTYQQKEQIEVEFSGFPGNQQDWITIVQASAPETTFNERFYLKGIRGGKHTFPAMPAGKYEVRGYFNWPEGGYTVRTRTAFSVSADEKQPEAITPPEPMPPVKPMPPQPVPPQPLPPGFPQIPFPQGIPGDALSLITKALTGFVLAIGVVFYLYWSLCLFLIAKKTRVAAAWTAWIPIVQIWTFVTAAGKPAWWIILLIVPLVNIVVNIYLWMCIAENLRRNKWLGLLILVPLVQLIFMGYLAFSREAERERPAV